MWWALAYRRGLQRETKSSPCPQETGPGEKMNVELRKVKPIVRTAATEASAQNPSSPGHGLTILVWLGPGGLPGRTDI